MRCSGNLASTLPKALIVASFAAVFLSVQFASFVYSGGDYRNEFRIAERDRQIGNILNELPGHPSLGVIAAGGIRMAYNGTIYDTLGLNWSAMARAESPEKAYRPKNHGAFNGDVFMAALPDVVFPTPGACSNMEHEFSPFRDDITGGIIREQRFQNTYRAVCWNEVVFFASSKYLSKLGEHGVALELKDVSYK